MSNSLSLELESGQRRHSESVTQPEVPNIFVGAKYYSSLDWFALSTSVKLSFLPFVDPGPEAGQGDPESSAPRGAHLFSASMPPNPGWDRPLQRTNPGLHSARPVSS